MALLFRSCYCSVIDAVRYAVSFLQLTDNTADIFLALNSCAVDTILNICSRFSGYARNPGAAFNRTVKDAAGNFSFAVTGYSAYARTSADAALNLHVFNETF